MIEAPSGGSSRQELIEVIREVRRRWRMRLALRGAIVVVAGGVATLLLASWGLQAAKFSPASITGFRIALFVIVTALVALWLVRPLRRRVSDVQVALYVEEHEPSLRRRF
jgi:hypothetical protein